MSSTKRTPEHSRRAYDLSATATAAEATAATEAAAAAAATAAATTAATVTAAATTAAAEAATTAVAEVAEVGVGIWWGGWGALEGVRAAAGARRRKNVVLFWTLQANVARRRADAKRPREAGE